MNQKKLRNESQGERTWQARERIDWNKSEAPSPNKRGPFSDFERKRCFFLDLVYTFREILKGKFSLNSKGSGREKKVHLPDWKLLTGPGRATPEIFGLSHKFSLQQFLPASFLALFVNHHKERMPESIGERMIACSKILPGPEIEILRHLRKHVFFTERPRLTHDLELPCLPHSCPLSSSLCDTHQSESTYLQYLFSSTTRKRVTF